MPTHDETSANTVAGLALWQPARLIFQEWIDEVKAALPHLPVTLMLAEGSLPILFRVNAELQREDPHTEIEVDDLSQRITRLFEFGLRLRHGQDLKGAACEFATYIEPVLEETLSRLAPNQPVATSSVWQAHVTRYLAGYIKEARQYRAAILEAWNRQAALRAPLQIGERQITYLEFSSMTADLVKAALRSLDLRQNEDTRWVLEQLIGLRELLAYEEKLMNALKRLPLRLTPTHLPADVRLGGETWCIEGSWLQTQLLLAAGQLPDAEFLRSEDFLPAFDQVQKVQQHPKLIETLFKRLRARGWQPLDAAEQELLRQHLTQRLKRMALWRRTIDHVTLSQVFLLINPETFHLSHKTALAAALDNRVGLPAIWADIPTDQIAEAINWSLVNEATLQRIIRTGVVPLRYLALQAHNMHRSKAAAKQRSETLAMAGILLDFRPEKVDQATLEALEERDLLVLNWDRVAAHVGKLSSSALAQFVRTQLPTTKHKRSAFKLIPAQLFIRVVRGMIPVERETILLAPKVRYEVMEYLAESLFNLVSLTNAGLDESNLMEFSRLFTPTTWRYMMLAYLLLIYRIEYTPAEAGELNTIIRPWDQAHTDRALLSQERLLSRLSLNQPKDFAKLLAEHTEQQVFQWLFAGLNSEQRARAWKTHERRRTAYLTLIARRKKK